MKWTENGVMFEGTPSEYKELHSDGYQLLPQRTRAGKMVEVKDGEKIMSFSKIKDAAEWIGQKTGRYVSSSTLSRMLSGEKRLVDLERFACGGQLFETKNNEGEENHVE